MALRRRGALLQDVEEFSLMRALYPNNGDSRILVLPSPFRSGEELCLVWCSTCCKILQNVSGALRFDIQAFWNSHVRCRQHVARSRGLKSFDIDPKYIREKEALVQWKCDEITVRCRQDAILGADDMIECHFLDSIQIVCLICAEKFVIYSVTRSTFHLELDALESHFKTLLHQRHCLHRLFPSHFVNRYWLGNTRKFLSTWPRHMPSVGRMRIYDPHNLYKQRLKQGLLSWKSEALLLRKAKPHLVTSVSNELVDTNKKHTYVEEEISNAPVVELCISVDGSTEQTAHAHNDTQSPSTSRNTECPSDRLASAAPVDNSASMHAETSGESGQISSGSGPADFLQSPSSSGVRCVLSPGSIPLPPSPQQVSVSETKNGQEVASSGSCDDDDDDEEPPALVDLVGFLVELQQTKVSDFSPPKNESETVVLRKRPRVLCNSSAARERNEGLVEIDIRSGPGSSLDSRLRRMQDHESRRQKALKLVKDGRENELGNCDLFDGKLMKELADLYGLKGSKHEVNLAILRLLVDVTSEEA